MDVHFFVLLVEFLKIKENIKSTTDPKTTDSVSESKTRAAIGMWQILNIILVVILKPYFYRYFSLDKKVFLYILLIVLLSRPCGVEGF